MGMLMHAEPRTPSELLNLVARHSAQCSTTAVCTHSSSIRIPRGTKSTQYGRTAVLNLVQLRHPQVSGTGLRMCTVYYTVCVQYAHEYTG
jgi:hypothetical protein